MNAFWHFGGLGDLQKAHTGTMPRTSNDDSPKPYKEKGSITTSLNRKLLQSPGPDIVLPKALEPAASQEVLRDIGLEKALSFWLLGLLLGL